MSKRFPLERWTLPDVVDPPDTICYVVPVPNDRFHQAAFMGAIYALTWSKNWARDAADTAAQVSRVWQAIFDNLERCKPDVIIGNGGADGDENMIRQNPDNPCELQTSIDGLTWCTFADFSLCLPSAPQPGGGTGQPQPGGGQECYQGEMQASALWLIPTIVNTGDVLDLQSITGAGNDGTVAIWYCPEGTTFFAGACILGTGHLDGADPLPTVNHMRILYLIDGNYYDAMAGPFTVPGGVVNQQVDLLVNDSVLADNSGSYQFKVCVTNNAALSYRHEFDFALSTWGWVWSDRAIAPSGTWSGGSGWVGQDYQSLSTDHFRGIEIQLTCPVVPISAIELLFDFTAGHYQDGAGSTDAIEVSTFVGATQTYRLVRLASAVTDGTNKSDSAAFSGSGITKIIVAIRTDEDDTSYAGFSGASLLRKVIVSGPGADPF